MEGEITRSCSSSEPHPFFSAAVHSSTEAKSFVDSAGFLSAFETFGNYACESLPGETALHHTTEHSLTLRIFSEKPKEKAQYDIPVDEDGTPLFPSIDLNATPLTAVKAAIMQYMEELWSTFARCRRDPDH